MTPAPPSAPRPGSRPDDTSLLPQRLARSRPLFDPQIVSSALRESFVKLNPMTLAKNPVMFVVEVGRRLDDGHSRSRHRDRRRRNIGFGVQIALWLWFTVLFANFAEAMAEARGKAQADTLRKTKTEVIGKKIGNNGKPEPVPGSSLRAGDIVLCEAGDIIPGDGEVIEGVASIDESVITGESAPVIRESGGDRSAVTGGTRVLSDWIKVQDHIEPRRDVHRSDDRARGRRAAPEDAERDRAQHPDCRAHADLPACGCHAAALCRIQRRRCRSRDGAERRGARGTARVSHPDDDRRIAVGDRYRRHGPRHAAQRARHERQGCRGVGRRPYAAARQDRHDHARQSTGGRVRAAAWRPGVRACRCRPARESRRRNT